MKIKKILLLCACLLAAGSIQLNAQNAQNMPQNIPDISTFSEDDTNKILKAFGQILALETPIGSLNFSDEQMEIIASGMKDAISNKQESMADLQKIMPKVMQYLAAREKSIADAAKKANNAASSEFFAKLDKDKNVQKNASGLYYEIIEEGNMPMPSANDTVTVKYKGSLIDGREFDSTEAHGGEPAVFPVSGVIPGFSQGLQLIGKGGKIKLYIPADLAYGDQSPQGSIITAGSPLVFELELIDVQAPSSEKVQMPTANK